MNSRLSEEISANMISLRKSWDAIKQANVSWRRSFEESIKGANVISLDKLIGRRPPLKYSEEEEKIASSEESVGDVGFRQLTKCMIQGDFGDVEGTEPVGFSHGQFGLVVQTLDHTAGELLPGAEVVQDQRAVRA